MPLIMYLELSHGLRDIDVTDIFVTDSSLYRRVSSSVYTFKGDDLPKSSSYSVSREAMRASSSSLRRVCISFSSWLCRRRSTVSRTSAWPSANCRRTVTTSS